MNKIELLEEIFKVCIIPLLGVLTTYLVKLIRKKSDEIQVETDSELLNEYLQLLTETVINCVITTNQTYVNDLKEKNMFDESAQKEAFNRTRNAVMALLTEDAKKYLIKAYGDLGVLITTMIESQVALNKIDKG